MAVTICLISVAVDIYIFSDIRKNYPRRRTGAVLYGIFTILCWGFLAACLAMPRRNQDSGILFLMWGIWGYLTVLVPKIIFTLFSLLGQIPRLWQRRPDGRRLNRRAPKSVKLGKWIGLPLAVVAFVAMWWGALVTRRQVEVVEVDVALSRLPKGFDGYRIAQISDLHVGTWGEDTSFIDRLVDSVNAQRPDVIFFTGDLVNRQSSELAPFLKSLAGLHAPDGVYSILGNHDYGDYLDWPSPSEKRENLQLLKNWQGQIGWRLLNNARTQLIHDGDTIQLIGVENWGEPPFHQYGHLIDAYPISTDSVYHLKDDRCKILLTHNPEHWRREVTRISNIDLSLAGHTHAMQTIFRIGPWRWSPSAMRYEEWGGLYSKQNPFGDTLRIYVNIGAGEVGLPYRIGAVPEITILTLRRSMPKDSTIN